MSNEATRRLAQLRYDLAFAALAVLPTQHQPGGKPMTTCERDAVGDQLAGVMLDTLAGTCPNARGVTLTADAGGKFTELDPIPWIDPDKLRMLDGYQEAAGISARVQAVDDAGAEVVKNLAGDVRVIGRAVTNSRDTTWADLAAEFQHVEYAPYLDHVAECLGVSRADLRESMLEALPVEDTPEPTREPLSLDPALDAQWLDLVDGWERMELLPADEIAQARQLVSRAHPPQTNTDDETNKPEGGPACH